MGLVRVESSSGYGWLLHLSDANEENQFKQNITGRRFMFAKDLPSNADNQEALVIFSKDVDLEQKALRYCVWQAEVLDTKSYLHGYIEFVRPMRFRSVL